MTAWCVVANAEEQYSVWSLDRPVPDGWTVAGPTGTRDECLDFIERTWLDMRPKSLRDRLAAAGSGDPQA